MKKVALDTNVVIEIMRGNSMVIQQMDDFQLFCLPVTVCGELLFGVFNSPKSDAEIQTQFLKMIFGLLQSLCPMIFCYCRMMNTF